MIVNFSFASAYETLLGQKNIQVALEADVATLDEALSVLLCHRPHWRVLLSNANLFEDGVVKAMFIWDQTILTGKSVLSDGCLVRVVSPICGG